MKTMYDPDNLQTEKIVFFDLLIDDINYDKLRTLVYSTIKAKQRLVINYANAYTVVLIQSNKHLKKALQEADILHSDGIGVWLGSKLFKGRDLKNRFNFTDCAVKMLDDFQSWGLSIFLVGSTNDILERALKKVNLAYPKLKVVGSLNGFDDINSVKVLEKINEKKPDILWVGMGTPAQELWIFESKNKLNCGVVQSVGDLITFLAGKKPRGPLIFQRIGLEWLIRFLRHPIRYFNRYIIGVPVFLYLILKEYFTRYKF